MSRLFASVDLGGTNIKCAFAREDGEILLSQSTPTRSHEGPQAVLDRMAHLVKDMEDASGEVPEGVGIGIPGLVDLRAGVTKFFPNFPTQWRDVPVREILEPVINRPVYLLNDVRTATLGELTFGHGKGKALTMVFFALGTGVGGGIVVDGKLRLGPMGAAGEIGHQTILPGGPLCGCGNRGCLETLASGPAITAAGVRLMKSGMAPRLHEITGGDASSVNPESVAAAAEQGDENVRDEIIQAAEFLGIGVANMVTTLHPDLVVLGGGVAQMGAILFDTVRATMLKRVGMFPPDEVQIKPSKLGDKAGTLGGIALAMNRGLINE
jgi:glucokinase